MDRAGPQIAAQSPHNHEIADKNPSKDAPIVTAILTEGRHDGRSHTVSETGRSLMSAQSMSQKLAEFGAQGAVSADDVLKMRRVVFADGVVSAEELDALFALAERAPDGDKEWPQFFAEVVADFYLREEEPQGYLTPEEVETLKARIMRDDGRVTELEMELLLSLLEKATQTPASMDAFVNDEIKKAIVGKAGGAQISARELRWLQRRVFAPGGDGNVSVTRREAEFLFELNDATAGKENDPQWAAFFATAITNHLMAHIGYQAPSREDAVQRHAFMSDQNANVGGVFSRLANASVAAYRDAVTSVFKSTPHNETQTQHNAQRDANIAEAERVTDNEADWLIRRINRDGALTENERALILRLREHREDLPPQIADILDRAA